MKRMKKLMALMIAMVMTLAMGVTAFASTDEDLAAPTESEITINDPVAGHTYTAYQILSGEVATIEGKEQLTNLDWGTGITDTGKTALKTALGLSDGATVAQVAVELAKIISDSTRMDEVAQILGDNKTGTGTELETVGNTVSATVEGGYY